MSIDGSILTNVPAKTAENVLNRHKSEIGEIQERISTGERINEAKDGPATFVTAKKMHSDVAVYKKIEENIGLSRQTLSVADSALQDIESRIQTIKKSITKGANGTLNGDDVQNEISGLVESIKDTIAGAQFNGQNILRDRQEVKFLAGMARTSDGRVDSQTMRMKPLDVERGIVGRLEAINPGNSADTLDLNIQNSIADQMTSAGLSADMADTVKQAIYESFDRWDQLFTNDRKKTIDIDVEFASLGGARIAEAKPQGAYDLNGDGVYKGTVEHKVQGNGDVNGSTRDAVVRIDTAKFSDLKFGRNGDGTYRAKDVLTHEFGHMFGIASAGSTTAWSEHVESTGSGYEFTGEKARNANGGQNVDLEDSGSGVHLDEDTYDEKLMTPVAEANERTPMSSMLGPMLQDMGYDASNTFQGAMQIVEKAHQATLDAMSRIGSMKQALKSQEGLVSGLADTLDTGVGEMVDANITEEAAKLKAKQAQKKMAQRALSIANQNPQSILQLLQG